MPEEKRQRLPANIKQIGSITGGLKIYVEDYVYTYIQQYAAHAECEEKIGVLTGRKEVFEDKDVLFINGIIQGKYSKNEAGMEVLTEESKAYIKDELKKYFKEDEILGWVYIQPGYGDFLNTSLINYHKNNFDKYYNVLFLFDPIEKVNCFFSCNEISNTLEEIKGYFIYYDRNEGMHEYMLQNKFTKPKEYGASAEGETDENGNYVFTEGSPDSENEIVADVIVDKIRKSLKKDKERIKNPRSMRQKGKIVSEQKKLVNFFGVLSAVLFCTCLVMGISIIKNDDRLNAIEKQISSIDNSYTYLVKTIKEGNVQDVFAQNISDDTKKATEKSPNSVETTSVKQTTTAVTTVTTEKATEATTIAKTTTAAKATTTVQKKEKEKNTNTENKSTEKYKVKSGDTLSSISIKFYGTVNKAQAIMDKNNLDNPDKIQYGMILELP